MIILLTPVCTSRSRRTQAEKSEDELKKESESVFNTGTSGWYYFGAALVVLSLLGGGLVNLMNNATARSGVRS